MNTNLLTAIALLIDVSETELNVLPETARNELITAYSVNTGVLDAVEITAELKRLYVHHTLNMILSNLAERFSLNPDTLMSLPESVKSDVLAQYENDNNYTAMYEVIQRAIQISSLSKVAKLLNITDSELEERYEYNTLAQLCGAYDMMNGIENNSIILKEFNSIISEGGSK